MEVDAFVTPPKDIIGLKNLSIEKLVWQICLEYQKWEIGLYLLHEHVEIIAQTSPTCMVQEDSLSILIKIEKLFQPMMSLDPDTVTLK